MTDLTQLLTAAAQNLSGHPVKIRFRKPARADAKAMTFKSGNTAIIDLHPGYGWDHDTLLFVICHEAAHVKQLWADWGSGIADLPSGSVTPSKWANALPGVRQVETAADTLARKWIAYAKRNHNQYANPGDDLFTAHLRALAGMNGRE